MKFLSEYLLQFATSSHLLVLVVGVNLGLWGNWFRLKPVIDRFRTLAIVQRRLRGDLEKAIYKAVPDRAWDIIESAHKVEDCTDLPCFICEVGDLSPTPNPRSERNR